MKIMIFMALSMAIPLFLLAQQPGTVAFFYDPGGNRTVRQIIPVNLPDPFTREEIKEESVLVDNTEIVPVKRENESPGMDRIILSISPNPVIAEITVEIGGLQPADQGNIKFLDVSGILLTEMKPLSPRTVFDVKSLEKGFYLVFVEINNRKIIRKVIKL